MRWVSRKSRLSTVVLHRERTLSLLSGTPGVGEKEVAEGESQCIEGLDTRRCISNRERVVTCHSNRTTYRPADFRAQTLRTRKVPSTRSTTSICPLLFSHRVARSSTPPPGPFVPLSCEAYDGTTMFSDRIPRRYHGRAHRSSGPYLPCCARPQCFRLVHKVTHTAPGAGLVPIIAGRGPILARTA